MKLICGVHNLTTLAGSAVTIGNFDGVHLGHQNMITRLVESSKLLGLPSVLISFAPTPQSFFNQAQAAISSFKQKHHLLEKLGLDIHLIIRFNLPFSQLSAEAFIQQILLDQLNMRYCLIGDDFRFGSGRAGDFTLLQKFSKQHGFEVQNTQSILHNANRVSSSRIRGYLSQGDFKAAAAMLGYEFCISGRIIRGKQLGRTVDFPTINLPIKRKISPVLGVFAVQVSVLGASYNGVCNVGKRPTVNGENILLEVFLFNFDQDIYGEFCTVIFKQKTRDEQKFDSFDKLKQQIKLDVKTAQSFFQLGAQNNQ